MDFINDTLYTDLVTDKAAALKSLYGYGRASESGP